MRFHRLLQGIAAWALVSALTLPAGWQVALAQEGVYSVGGIAVDITAETATQARENAIGQAQFAALQALFQRLVVQEDLARLPLPSREQITDLVQDFSVANEKTSAGRYLADFTVRFKPAAVRAVFQGAVVRFAETRSKPVLVLPIFGAAGEAVLWREPNPWRAAWTENSLGQGLVPVLAPLADLSDMASLDAKQALAGDLERIGALAGRYGATNVLITYAVLFGDPVQGQASLQVRTRRLSLRQAEQTKIEISRNYLQAVGEDLPALLARAVAGTIVDEETKWKQANLLNFGTRRNLLVRVPVTALPEWLEIKRRLEGVASVLTTEVIFLKRNEVRLNLTFIGEVEQLMVALAQIDLALSRETRLPVGGGLAPGTGTSLTPGAGGLITGSPSARGAGPEVWTLRSADAGSGVPSGGGQSGNSRSGDTGAAGSARNALPSIAGPAAS